MALTNSKPQEIFQGDRVRIKAQGVTRTGVCDTVQYYGNQYGIELTDDNGHYWYWKQWADGGTVVKL